MASATGTRILAGQFSLLLAQQAGRHTACVVRDASAPHRVLLTLSASTQHWSTLFASLPDDHDQVRSSPVFADATVQLHDHAFHSPPDGVFLPFDDAEPWPTARSFCEIRVPDAAAVAARLDDAAAELRWFDGQQLLADHARARLHIDPVALQALRQSLTGALQPLLELAPGLFAAALHSPTLPPFKRTNTLLIVADDSDDEQLCPDSSAAVECGWAVVDPGCSAADLQQLLAAAPPLRSDVARPLVVVTHHHADHVAGLPALLQLCPDARLAGHPDILPLLSPDIRARVDFVPLPDRCSIRVRSSSSSQQQRVWQVLHSPGHTKTHVALWHPSSRTLLAGDHMVGRGSAVLDSCSGGDMSDYLATCRAFVALQPRCIVPAHGNPSYQPRALLEQYIAHRLQREEQILACCLEIGSQQPADIVRKVYANVPSEMWPAAEKNIELHLRKLRIDGRL